MRVRTRRRAGTEARAHARARATTQRKLDPLEFYCPVVLEAREQLAQAGEVGVHPKRLHRACFTRQHASSSVPVRVAHTRLHAPQAMITDAELARKLLRSGPLGGVRENVRVLGEYAVQNKRAAEAGPLVNGFFRALEDYDFELREAIRWGGGCQWRAQRAQW